MITLFQGFLLGLAYVAPIGTQNMFLINTAIRQSRSRSLQAALIIVLFDISLALACFWGIGLLVDKVLFLKGLILLVGSVAVMVIGFRLISTKPQDMEITDVKNSTISSMILTSFVVTWLNPQAIIDGSLLLGGIYATLPNGMVEYFILGVCLASLTWFTGLAVIVSIFRNQLNPNLLRYLNIFCGGVIIFYGIKLGYNFIQIFR